MPEFRTHRHRAAAGKTVARQVAELNSILDEAESDGFLDERARNRITAEFKDDPRFNIDHVDNQHRLGWFTLELDARSSQSASGSDETEQDEAPPANAESGDSPANAESCSSKNELID